MRGLFPQGVGFRRICLVLVPCLSLSVFPSLAQTTPTVNSGPTATSATNAPTQLLPRIDVFAAPNDSAETPANPSSSTPDLAPDSLSEPIFPQAETSVIPSQSTTETTPSAVMPQGVDGVSSGVLTPNQTKTVNDLLISRQSLSPVSAESVGLLSDYSGGFSEDLWAGLGHADLYTLLTSLPNKGMHSPLWNSILRRMLLSRAIVPVAGEAPTDDTAIQQDLTVPSEQMSILALRVQWLLNAGFVDDALKLAQLKSRLTPDADILKDVVLGQLVIGAYEDACADIRAEQARSTDRFWQDALIICQVQSGNLSGASLAIELMSEMFPETNDIQTQLIEAATGVFPLDGPVEATTPLDIVLVRVSGAEMDSGLIDSLSPLALQAVANSKEMPPHVVLHAQERLAMLGAFGAEELAAAYMSVSLDEPKLSEPDTTEDTVAQTQALSLEPVVQPAIESQPVTAVNVEPDTTRDPVSESIARARLFQSVNGGDAPDAYALTNLWATPDRRLSGPLMQATTLQTLQVTPDELLLPIMPDMVRALVYGQRIDAAARWDQKARRLFLTNVDAAVPALRESWVWFKLAGEPATVSIEDLTLWRNTRTDTPAAEQRASEELLLTLLQDVGHTVPQAVWRSLTPSQAEHIGVVPDMVTWNALTNAVEQKNTGEALLLAALLAGDNPANRIPNMVLSRQIRVLAVFGLTQEARTLAAETALYAGL